MERATETPRGALILIRGMFSSLRPSEQKVAGYILEHPEDVIHLSVTEMARKCGTSDATVIKFCQRLGYSGYQQFKIRLAREMVSPTREIYGEIEPDDDLVVTKHKLFEMNRRALTDTEMIVDNNELLRAVEAIARARQVHVYGIGASGFVALDAEHKFLRIGVQCHAVVEPDDQLALSSILTPDDMAIGISYSGHTKDTVDALANAKAAGAFTCCITNGIESPITKYADAKLYTASEESSFRSGALASRVAQLAIVDVLFIGVVQRRYEETLYYLDKTREAVAHKKY